MTPGPFFAQASPSRVSSPNWGLCGYIEEVESIPVLSNFLTLTKFQVFHSKGLLPGVLEMVKLLSLGEVFFSCAFGERVDRARRSLSRAVFKFCVLGLRRSLDWRSLARMLAIFITMATAGASAAPLRLRAVNSSGQVVGQVPVELSGKQLQVWSCDEKIADLTFKPEAAVSVPSGGVLYVQVSYLDRGYGKLSVELSGKDGNVIRPDRSLGLTRSDTGSVRSARMRMSGIRSTGKSEVAVRIGLERSAGDVLLIESVILQDMPFDDAQFAYVISEPWKGPYTGRSVKPQDNSTLKGKVMAGYQGWFRTPNDPDGRGWFHWGNIQNGTFTTDMWPDVSKYPVGCLEKAGAVKLASGKPGYLFSSAWPDVVDTHFRLMREHDIDGVFLQRFVSDNFHSINGSPEWVLANVRAAAHREGRLWAVEYDVSGYPDAKLLETLRTDWRWLVDEFGVRGDANYAREGGKPVVFIWGLPFPDRRISVATANAVVEFFRNDPKYGGNYVIGGIPNNWRTLPTPWQEHLKQYACVLPWMSESYVEDLADFGKLGISCYTHVSPGFSWANLKHLPGGDLTVAYTPREGGRRYWNLWSKAAKAHCEQIFVGMFDEYDEGTAILPMSDDVPVTPVRTGVAATFFNGPAAREHGELVHLPELQLALGEGTPARGIAAANFFVRMGGQIVFPSAGAYTFLLQGAPGDDADLTVDGQRILTVKGLTGTATATTALNVAAGAILAYRLDYRHGNATGTLRLLWQSPSIPRQSVPPAALQDAWGRFITNEGKPADWWLKLTHDGKEMINGKRPADAPMPSRQ